MDHQLFSPEFWQETYGSIYFDNLNLSNIIIPTNEFEFPIIFELKNIYYIIYNFAGDKTYWDEITHYEHFIDDYVLLHLKYVKKAILVKIDYHGNLSKYKTFTYMDLIGVPYYTSTYIKHLDTVKWASSEEIKVGNNIYVEYQCKNITYFWIKVKSIIILFNYNFQSDTNKIGLVLCESCQDIGVHMALPMKFVTDILTEFKGIPNYSFKISLAIKPRKELIF